METLKFKVGDKVRVKSLEWYNEKKDVFGDIVIGKKFIFLDRMSEYCGKVLEITEVCDDYYRTDGNDYIWQEWMLVPVAEEKRNKIIEASLQPITKEQAKKLLVGTKYFCTAYADTDRLQKKLFECGCEWSDIGEKINIERWAIFVNAGGILTHENKEVVVWCEDSNIPILIDDVLAIQIKEEEKPKFDPQTLQPFDKVLVRDKVGNKWFCTLFSHIEGKNFICTSSFWECCIPYNEDTKHLVGTTKDAPEFYRI